MTSKKITVLSPRGTAPPIQLVPMAVRLDTLEGKTIYIVDVNFPRTHPFFEEMHRLLVNRYPGTTWILKTKIGTYFHNDPKLWDEIKEKGDGAIMGIGQLDTCAPSVIIFCSILEKSGVPTAPVVTNAFPELIRNFAYKKGMPQLRFTFVPHPFANRPFEVHRRYLEGSDPISGKPVLEEIAEALTKPTTDEEKKTGTIERPALRRLEPDTPENLERLFLEKGWTDYLPIVLPTEEKVAKMLEGTTHKPDEVVGRMQPSPPHEAWEQSIANLGGSTAIKGAPKEHFPAAMQPSPPHEAWEYTVEHVAVNAVMAGARTEHFPAILAIASTGVTSLFSSATSFSRMVVANGPMRKEMSMNCGLGALGPFNQANAVIGRAWTLISKNLGGAKPRETYLGDIGNNYNYNNMCFAENEEVLPEGWNPFHVQRDFKAEESVVSLLSGWSLLNYAAYKQHPHHEIMKWQLTSFETSGAGTHHTPGINPGTQAALLLSPITANDLRNEGFESKEKLSQWLKKNTYMTLWDYWAAMPDDLESAKAGIEPFASLLKLPTEAKSPRPLILQDAPVEIVVVGGGTDAFWMAGDFYCLASASVDMWR
jgi:hypothetical protein